MIFHPSYGKNEDAEVIANARCVGPHSWPKVSRHEFAAIFGAEYNVNHVLRVCVGHVSHLRRSGPSGIRTQRLRTGLIYVTPTALMTIPLDSRRLAKPCPFKAFRSPLTPAGSTLARPSLNPFPCYIFPAIGGRAPLVIPHLWADPPSSDGGATQAPVGYITSVLRGYCAGLGMATAPCERMRCPAESFPARTPANSSGTTSPSSMATSQRTGRTKRSLGLRQYIFLGQ